MPVSRRRVFVSLGIAALLSASVFYFGRPLVQSHARFANFIVNQAQIPMTGVRGVPVFPEFGSVEAPVIRFAYNRMNPPRTVLLFASAVLVLLAIHKTVPLSRNFVIFLLVLLSAAVVVILVTPSFDFDSVTYTQIWLRGEVLIWLILPGVSAFLFMMTLPSLLTGVAWAVLLQVFAVVWSAVRLAFCLGVLHFTGILFLPLLWFCLGALADLVYVLVFYSFALRLSISQITGERA